MGRHFEQKFCISAIGKLHASRGKFDLKLDQPAGECKNVVFESVEDTRIPDGLRGRGGGEADEVRLRPAAMQPRAWRRG